MCSYVPYCYCHLFYHNFQLRNARRGIAQNESSKNGVVGDNAEFVSSCCFMFDQTMSYSTQTLTSLIKPKSVSIACRTHHLKILVILALLVFYFEDVRRLDKLSRVWFSRVDFFPPTCSSLRCVPFSFMQSTSSVTGIALVLRSKSVLDLLPWYVDLHLSNMIFLKYFMVLFFTVTKHIVFIMLLLIAMHSTM